MTVLQFVPTEANDPGGRSDQRAFIFSMSARNASDFRVSRNSVPADMIATRRPPGLRNSKAWMT